MMRHSSCKGIWVTVVVESEETTIMLPIESTSEKGSSKFSGSKGACAALLMIAAAVLAVVFIGRSGASAQQAGDNGGGGPAPLGAFEIYSDNQIASAGTVDE